MNWDHELLPEQRVAAAHTGSHALLLAGPGTGKTRVITRRILYLVNEQGVNPKTIVALTFTRAATQELRARLGADLPKERMPWVATLHSFALRQLLRNSRRLTDLPLPLHIADDYEERYVVLEHLKSRLDHAHIKVTKELFARLSSDWETLQADVAWTVDPGFVAQWSAHRSVFGYTLRAELTYRLKRALENLGTFEIESPITHLIVDEYQDLNKCDLAVIDGIARKSGAEIFVAGDDDQSIYGFRKAHPAGIRNFARAYPGTRELPLTICKRCDPAILSIAEFVAQLDVHRLPKTLVPENGRTGGIVRLLRFPNQDEEATAIARLIRHAVDVNLQSPGDFLILLRSDHLSAYSKIIRIALEQQNIPVASVTESDTLFSSEDGRILIAFLRLIADNGDDLSLWQLLELRANSIGSTTLGALYDLATQSTQRFSQVLQRVSADPTLVQRGDAVKTEFDTLTAIARSYAPLLLTEYTNTQELADGIRAIAARVIPAGDGLDNISREVATQAARTDSLSLQQFIESLSQESEDIQQERDLTKVNILTMHRAKGLTSHSVIVVAAEDEVIPGRQNQEPELGDERRLLYVSLSRAEHRLIVTYCDQRLGQQRRLGSNPGNPDRTLTQFLRDSHVHAEEGLAYLHSITEAPPA
jgi:DNA helicase II / ATP-dependent DNA helicase PcrA